jgi:hypothetical protein
VLTQVASCLFHIVQFSFLKHSEQIDPPHAVSLSPKPESNGQPMNRLHGIASFGVAQCSDHLRPLSRHFWLPAEFGDFCTFSLHQTG